MVYHHSMSRKQECFILQLDEMVLRRVLDTTPAISKNQQTVFNCHCPFCLGKRRQGKTTPIAKHATANVFRHKNGEGLSFGCAACGKVECSIHRLLCDLQRPDLADWYAQKRYECDKACGRGWTCPNPLSVKQALSEKRRCLREKAAIKKIQSSMGGMGDH